MTSYDDSAMIAFPVSWPEDPQAHVTLQYLGEHVVDFPYGPMDVLGVMSMIDWPNEIDVQVEGVQHFGEEQEFRVAVLDTAPLLFWYNMLKTFLEAFDINQQNGKEWPVYRPHITLTGLVDESDYIPEEVVLYRPALYWGDSRY